MNKRIEELADRLEAMPAMTNITIQAPQTIFIDAARALRLIGPLVAEHEDTSCQDKSSFPCTCKWHTSEAALDEYRRNWSESDGAEQT